MPKCQHGLKCYDGFKPLQIQCQFLSFSTTDLWIYWVNYLGTNKGGCVHFELTCLIDKDWEKRRVINTGY